jgi:hypothetical protein
MRKTSKGKLISKLQCISPPKTRWEKYEEKLYLGYLLKNSAEKTEDMIYIICLEYPFKNPGGENLRYDTEYCLIKNLV